MKCVLCGVEHLRTFSRQKYCIPCRISHNREKAKEYFQKHKRVHSERFKQNRKRYRQKNKKRLYLDNRKRMQKNTEDWKGYIPAETYCRICKKTIYFGTPIWWKNIAFDHRNNDDIPIKFKSPTVWLKTHERNKMNEKIWEKCNFGILCNKCNRLLPTKNRKQYVMNINKYVFGNQIAP